MTHQHHAPLSLVYYYQVVLAFDSEMICTQAKYLILIVHLVYAECCTLTCVFTTVYTNYYNN